MITLENVTKSFTPNDGGKQLALNPINLNVAEGEFLSIVGPSGCGKTTLLRMIAGLDFPTSGRVLEGEIEITGPSRERGYVFQQYSLFPWRDVRDNVAFGLEMEGLEKKERYSKAREYLKLVGLSPYEKSYPRELSGGMKQRVAIARSLVNDPHVLLMDEPFSALDVQTRHKLQEELVRIWSQEQKTVIFVTHNVDEAVFLADRVVVLSQRPATVLKTFEINLERVRDRSAPEFLDLKKEITSLLEIDL
ncbi:ABC transporter ATP-binding protein [Methanobacterium sp. BAmetb5]|uniref:ABC transporter ATP-binding protein n=1 Tax=Methanobacterium sp. BAmetb5 TaxID=2025351 RepID=UPI000E81A214|nr:ABC transporter ATP-binding protein [Methanobacterium sp. BAmetb5]AXV40026.1 MAG: nitrate ABC transporter ATP-binding protein [Methanobacterium sp. BAmetb5]